MGLKTGYSLDSDLRLVTSRAVSSRDVPVLLSLSPLQGRRDRIFSVLALGGVRIPGILTDLGNCLLESTTLPTREFCWSSGLPAGNFDKTPLEAFGLRQDTRLWPERKLADMGAEQFLTRSELLILGQRLMSPFLRCFLATVCALTNNMTAVLLIKFA